MSNILFVSETYIKENTPLSQNVDIKDIVNNIDPAQDLFTQPIMGQNFYKEILTKYDAQTLNANEIVLVGHIKIGVAYRAAEMALPFVHYQIKNKGVQTQDGDFSASAERSDMVYLRNELKNRAEFYEARLISYLCDNEALFSGYTTNNSTDISPSDESPYDGGFALYD